MFFFFFKQKTAYEMRISDWSSDVCSSDLELLGADVAEHQPHGLVCGLREIGIGFDTRRDHHPCRAVAADHHRRRRDLDAEALAEFGTALEIHLCEDRKSTRLNSSH